MSTIVRLQQYSYDRRKRTKCGQCDRVRLCTRCRLTIEGQDKSWEEWFCNECMCATPPWSSIRRREG